MPAPPVFGFLLPLIETVATAVGAGVIVGTFGGATAGFLLRRSRSEVEGNTLRDGYFGALTALMTWIIEGRNV